MAASASSIRAGRAFVELFADNSALTRDLKKSEQLLRQFGTNVADVGKKAMLAGTAAVTALAGAVKLFSGMGDSAVHSAACTGLTVEAFTALAYAANMADVSTERLEVALKMMQKTIALAATGSKTAVATLALLKLSFKDLIGLPADEQMAKIAERLAGVRNPAMQSMIALKLFGRSATLLMPLLKEGSAGIARFTDEAQRLGLVMSTQDAEAAAALDKSFKRMWLTIKMAVFNVGSALAPMFGRLVSWVTAATVSVSRFVKQHHTLITWVFLASVALTVLGASAYLAGTAFVWMAGVIAAALAFVKFVMAALAPELLILDMIVLAIGAAALAMVALGAYVLFYTKAGEEALAALGAKFAWLGQDIKGTFGGISDALAAGDITLAAKVLWAALKMEWIRGVNWITGIWDGALHLWAVGFSRMWYGALYAVTWVWNAMVGGFDVVVNAILSSLDAIGLGATVVWENMKAGALMAWNAITGLWDKSFDTESANAAAAESRDTAIEDARQAAAVRGLARSVNAGIGADERQARLDAIVEQGAGVEEALDEEYAAKVAAKDERFKKAQKEWEDAIEEARIARLTVVGEANKTGWPGEGVPAVEEMRAASGFSRGTFGSSAGALLGLMASTSVTERIASASEKALTKQDEIRRAIEEADGAMFE